MQEKMIFKMDDNLFPADQINKLKDDYEKKMVVIVDPTISNKKYDVYERGLKKNIY
jgi:hypothetical protein